MPAVSRYLPPDGWSQRNQKTETDFTEQHGSKYHATIEVKTGDPCGLIEPQFQAPLMPPQQFLKRVPRRPYSLQIDYAAWKAETREAWREWQKQGRDTARKLHGDAYNADRPFTGEILDIIGPAPTPIDPIIAAEQGNKWVLGLTNRVDMRLWKFFEPENRDPDYSDPDEEQYGDDDEEEEGGPVAAKVKSPPTGKTAPKLERNAAIVADLETMSLKSVAEKYGISEPRVRQIRDRAMQEA